MYTFGKRVQVTHQHHYTLACVCISLSVLIYTCMLECWGGRNTYIPSPSPTQQFTVHHVNHRQLPPHLSPLHTLL